MILFHINYGNCKYKIQSKNRPESKKNNILDSFIFIQKLTESKYCVQSFFKAIKNNCGENGLKDCFLRRYPHLFLLKFLSGSLT